MNDTKTLIRSSLISLIIVILGLFTLCISRAPKINVDEPLIEGGGSFSDDVDLSDDNFLSLLESASEELNLEDDSNSGTDFNTLESESYNTDEDQELAELFDLMKSEEGESGVSNADEGDDISELEKLLFSDDESGSSFDESTDSDNSSTLEKLLLAENEDTGNNELFADNSQVSDLENEISRLEKSLKEKDGELENIQKSITEYDEKIASLERGTFSSPKKSDDSFRFASYQATENNEATAIPGNEFDSASNYGESYDIALSYFKNRDYKLAKLAFEQLLQESNRSSIKDNCQYWLGECEFALGNYYQAIVEFEKVFSYDAPDKKDDAQIMLGLAYMKLGEVNQAKEDFSWLLFCYKGSEYYNRAMSYFDQL